MMMMLILVDHTKPIKKKLGLYDERAIDTQEQHTHRSNGLREVKETNKQIEDTKFRQILACSHDKIRDGNPRDIGDTCDANEKSKRERERESENE